MNMPAAGVRLPAGPALPSRETWLGLVDVARFAPTPHNGQVCRVALDPDDPSRAALLFDPAGGIPNTDPGSRFTYVGMGCFIETLSRAAAAHGLALGYALDGEEIDATRAAGDVQHVATLTLTPSTGPIVDETALLLKRATSRLRFNRVRVPSTVIESCARVAAEWGQSFEATDEPGRVRRLVGLNRKTVFYDLNDSVARTELGGFMRYTEKDALLRGDGFSPSSLGMPGSAVKLFFKHHRLSTAPVIKQIFSAIYAIAGGGVHQAFWFRGPFDTHADHINAGRAMLSSWVELTRDGVYAQPFGSVVTNQRANAELQTEMKTADAPGSTLWLVGRMGHSRKTPPRSYRLPLERVIV